MDSYVTRVWSALYSLHGLLTSHSNTEEDYQRIFEHHSVLFSVLGLDEAHSFEKRSPYSLPFDPDRNFRPEPDFIGANPEQGLLSVVELKTPFVGTITTARSDGNRVKLKGDAESYVSQASEYVEAIRGNSEARALLKKLFRMERIADYRIVLLLGLAEDNDPAAIAELMS